MSGPTLYRLPAVRGNTAAGIYLGASGTAVGIVLLSIWVTTQLTAYRLHFHPALGSPLIALRSPYRELLGPAAVLTATLGVGGLMMPTWRSQGKPDAGPSTASSPTGTSRDSDSSSSDRGPPSGGKEGE